MVNFNKVTMSTKCQVVIEQEGLKVFNNEKPWEKTKFLHHDLGHPEDMVPLFVEAYVISGGGLEAGMSGKVASFLSTAGRGGFDKVDSKTIPHDLAYFYRVRIRNGIGEKGLGDSRWEVAVFIPARKWYDSTIASWEMRKGVSSFDDEPVLLTTFDPKDYKDCINQSAFRRVGTARLKMRGGKVILDLTPQLSDMLGDYS